MGRRANGEGSIFKEKSGRYRIAITIEIAGRRKRITKTAWKHSVAVEELRKLREQNAGRRIVHDVGTVGQLIERWMAAKCRPSTATPTVAKVARATLSGREATIKNHITPYIGDKKLRAFDAQSAEDFAEQLRAAKAGPRAIQVAWDACRSAFKYGVRMRIVDENPFTIASAPIHKARKMMPFNADEVQQILTHAKGTRHHALLAVLFYTGIRQGEAFGLRWDRINIPEKYMVVDSQAVEISGHNYIERPKTESSIRTINLPDIVVEALRSHKVILLKEGNAGSDFVFPAKNGSLLLRTNWWADFWKPTLRRLGIHHRGAHNTRHTFATLSLSSGTDIAVVSKILGHSKVTTTYETYIHAMPASERQAVKKIEVLYG